MCERLNVTLDDKYKLLVHVGCYEVEHLFKCKTCEKLSANCVRSRVIRNVIWTRTTFASNFLNRFNTRSTICRHVRYFSSTVPNASSSMVQTKVIVAFDKPRPVVSVYNLSKSFYPCWKIEVLANERRQTTLESWQQQRSDTNVQNIQISIKLRQP